MKIQKKNVGKRKIGVFKRMLIRIRLIYIFRFLKYLSDLEHPTNYL